MDSHWNKWLGLWKGVSGDSIFHAVNNLMDRDEIAHRLKEITCPALVTHGTDDTAIPVALGEALSKELPNCKGFVIAPGAHAPNLTHPHIINPPVIRFLDELNSSSRNFRRSRPGQANKVKKKQVSKADA